MKIWAQNESNKMQIINFKRQQRRDILNRDKSMAKNENIFDEVFLVTQIFPSLPRFIS